MRDEGPLDVGLPMTPRFVRDTIERAWRALEKLADTKPEAQELFARANEASVKQERGHRRMGRGFNTNPYRQSVETAARYYVLKWFLFPARIDNALDAATVTETCLLASALRISLGKVPNVPSITDVQGIDYVEHIAQPMTEPAPRARRARRPVRDDWQREEAMQLGMGLGAEAYNDAMGY